MSARRIAVIGASGQLGSALMDVFAGRELIAPTHVQLAFDDTSAVAALLDRAQPDVLINCSAFHHVDTCEREPERAFAVNALAVDGAAEACAARGVAFATVSTDYVFAGTLGRAYREDDGVGPLTAYGASKAAGEFLTRRHGARHWIVRTSGVFGTAGTSNKGYTLIEKVLRQAERGEPTRMVADMIFSPSYAPHVARAMRDLIDAEAYGTHHVTNAGATLVVRVRARRVRQSRARRRAARTGDLRVAGKPDAAPDALAAREHDVRARRDRRAAALGGSARRLPRRAQSAARRNTRVARGTMRQMGAR